MSGDGAGVRPYWPPKAPGSKLASGRYGGDAWFDAGGDGNAIGRCREEAGGRIGAGRLAHSKKFANLPSRDCHFAQDSADVNRQYFMLLKNSTSMM